jgi:hypothetical protein
MKDNSELIIQNLGFLTDVYNFRISRQEFDITAMGNAIVVFSSSKYNIEIVIDRNQVLISIGESKDNRDNWFEFVDVMKYYAPHETDIYQFPEKTKFITTEDIITSQLTRLAQLIRHNCEPILLGKNWNKVELKKIEGNRTAEFMNNLSN